ncbi:MAG TPA: DHA2 family efflux MFS transporter permease subunit [Dehalococcoidia bacterium]|nr:DHA2 family efflux MFS transporter permease subunit [Dehalococcoidia bacterium]
MRRLEYKYVVATVFVLGLFMDLMDSTITNVAVPTLAKDFRAGTTTVEWVVTGYLLSLAIFIPLSGWAGDRFGTKRTFMFALSMFTLSSFLCGVAWNIEALVAFRVLQGVGGGMMTPVGTAMLYRAFPPAERAKASSILAIPAALAPTSGPVLGGYLVEFQSWHWIFWVNLPVGLTALALCAFFLREHREETSGRLDLPGLLLSASGLASLVYALAQAGTRGFGDRQVLGFGGAGLALVAALVIVELRVPRPMIDMRLFKDKLFSASNLVGFLSFGGSQGAFFLVPLFLQAERGMSPLQSGLTTFPMAVGMMMLMPFTSRVYMQLGPRRMMMLGLLVMSLATGAWALIDLQTNDWLIRFTMLVRGWGFAFVLIPSQTATFATIKSQDTGRASAVFNSLRQVAASLGVALMGTVLANRLLHNSAALGDPRTLHGAVLGFHDAFFVAALLGAVGIAAALLIDDRLAAGTMRRILPQPEPVAEPSLVGTEAAVATVE